jgi:hypothetical protein
VTTDWPGEANGHGRVLRELARRADASLALFDVA